MNRELLSVLHLRSLVYVETSNGTLQLVLFPRSHTGRFNTCARFQGQKIFSAHIMIFNSTMNHDLLELRIVRVNTVYKSSSHTRSDRGSCNELKKLFYFSPLTAACGVATLTLCCMYVSFSMECSFGTFQPKYSYSGQQ